MEKTDFLRLFAEQFDDTPIELFTLQLKYKDLDEWSSVTALSVISMVDDEFDKLITGADLRSVETIEELYDLIQKK